MKKLLLSFALLISLSFSLPNTFASETPNNQKPEQTSTQPKPEDKKNTDNEKKRETTSESTGTKPYPAPLWAFVLAFSSSIAIILIGLNKLNFKAGSQWNLAEALTEDQQRTILIDPNDPNKGTKTITEQVSSSSRLIAFSGLIIILSLYTGIGFWFIYNIMTTGTPPEKIDSITSFLTTGLVLFAPYAANQIKEATKPKS